MSVSPSLVRYHLTADDQLVFLHIPKTAGLTFTSLLQARYGDEIDPRRFWYEPRWSAFSIASANAASLHDYRVFAGHYYYDVCRLLPGRPICLTFLRHPVRRVLSLYNYYRAHETHPHAAAVAALSFEEFITCAPDSPFFEMTHNHMTTLLGRRFAITVPEDIRTAVPIDEDRLAIAQQRLREMAFVGITERFADSLALLCYTLDWTPIAAYENRNVTANANKLRVKDVPEATIYQVMAHNVEDMQLYDLACGLFEDRWQQYQRLLSAV